MATSDSAFVDRRFQAPCTARVDCKLNVRTRPSVQAERVRRLEPGAQVEVDRSVRGDNVLGSDLWYGVAGCAEFFWSGGVSLRDMPAAAPVAERLDPAIETLGLAGAARAAAYALKAVHPSVIFTSGRRNKVEQARAMAGNVMQNRQWIEQTYAFSALRTQCQQWVNQNPEKTTQAEIADGLLSIFDAADDAALGRFSKHLSGQAFDVQPVEEEPQASSIKASIEALPGLQTFLDKEGGLVRWHAQF